MLKKDYRFDGTFDVFNEIDKHNKFYEYKPRTSNKINANNTPLHYSRIIAYRLIDMFPASSIIKKVSNVNHRSYMHDNFKRNWRKKIHTILEFF